jgi:beta-phosphoglucomutase-like phosphatase (HAD superfamily)
VKFEVVIFDMDGLMLDTERLAPQAWHDAKEAIGVDFDMSLLDAMVGRNYQDCRALILERHGAAFPTDRLMDAWHVAYDAIVARDGIGIKHGLFDLLDWLEQAHIPKAVATSTRRSRAMTKLEGTGLATRFTALVGGDEIARGKPAPDIFLLAAERLGAEPASCLVLEDSAPGIRAALAAGMTPIMVPDQHDPAADILASGTLVLPSLAHVQAHLQRNAANGIIGG